MKKMNVNKVTITLIVILIVGLIFTIRSYADDTIPEIPPSTVISSGNNTPTTTTTNTPSTNVPAATLNTNIPSTNTKNTSNTLNGNTSSSSYNNTNLPRTGISDYSYLFVIGGALGVVAFVAYKKAEYYKNI